ncbi:protein of unknown function [Bradyrhizobium vignae]|uniref:Uncharacterized protein n=1 Tax=Bradyrhizobium vignae TaxID=1549949 RepID=A0A2U3PVM8_9BRAD|nr:protein of unknown function [Bradyrhizobium vignae]
METPLIVTFLEMARLSRPHGQIGAHANALPNSADVIPTPVGVILTKDVRLYLGSGCQADGHAQLVR